MELVGIPRTGKQLGFRNPKIHSVNRCLVSTVLSSLKASLPNKLIAVSQIPKNDKGIFLVDIPFLEMIELECTRMTTSEKSSDLLLR